MQRSNILSILLLLLTALLVLTIFALASVPPVSRDALTHHLYVPRLFLKAGGIIELPHIPFSYYPMNLDLLYMIPLFFGNDMVPKYIHFLFALLTAWLLFRYLDKKFGRLYGLFSAFFFLSIPVVIKLSTTVYVDLGLICFTTGALLMLAEWRESGFPISKLVWAGIFCGLALGTKYNGLVTFALLSLMVPVLFLRANAGSMRNQIRALYQGALFAVIALIVFSPWMVRNLVWTGNPVYPLYREVFAKLRQETTSNFPQDEEEDIQEGGRGIKWTPFNLRSIIYGESKWDIATIPVRVFFQGQDDNPKYFDGVLAIWLIVFPLGLFLKARSKNRLLPSVSILFLVFAVCYLLVVFFNQDMRVRWISPIVPPLIILSTAGLYRVSQRIGEAWPRLDSNKDILVLSIATICILTTSIPYIVAYYKKVAPLDYIAGNVNREAYIAKYRPEYPVVRYANEHLDQAAKILCVFVGNRGYYFDNPVRFSNRFTENYVIPFHNAKEMVETIRKKGFQYVIVNYAILNRRINEGLSHEQQKMTLAFFTKELTMIFKKNGYGLYMVNSSAG